MLDWFQQLRLRTEDFKSDDESKRMREAGNDSYRKDHHSLKAADFYTEAIFLAPAQNSIAAAMAHANRSTVLHDCGMYQVCGQFSPRGGKYFSYGIRGRVKPSLQSNAPKS